MRIKLIIIPVLLIIGGYSFFWYQMAEQAEKTTLEWIENSETRLDGIKTYVGDISVSGFPYRIVVEASTLNILVPEGRLGSDAVSINLPEVAAVYQPWKPNHIIVVTDYFDAVQGQLQSPVKTFSFDKVKSSIILDPESKALANLSVVADKITWVPGEFSDEAEQSQIEAAEFHVRKSMGENSTDVSYDLPLNRAIYFKGSNAVVSELEGTLLGKNADAFKVEALLHANKQPKFTKNDLARWRDEGGTLSIGTFEYGTEKTGFKFSGDVTLDENFKPLGAFDATVTDMPGLLLNLAENEELPEMTRMLLQTQAQSVSMPGEVPIPISMQNGLLYLGPIMLMELPAVIQ